MECLIPKLNFIYFKDLLDLCFKKFFDDFNDDFIKDGNNYVYGRHATKTKLKTVFRSYLKEELKKILTTNDVRNGNFYFVIGSCIPKDNILLKVDDRRLPTNLAKLVN